MEELPFQMPELPFTNADGRSTISNVPIPSLTWDCIFLIQYLNNIRHSDTGKVFWTLYLSNHRKPKQEGFIK